MKTKMKMKRAIAATAVAVGLAATLAGCGNMSLGLGNFDFSTVHVCDHAGNCKDFSVKKWYDTETGIELQTKDGTSMFLSEGTYILFENDCPLCN